MSALDDLQEFRQMLVIVGRNCAAEVWATQGTSAHGARVWLKSMSAIDAVDKATADETKIAAAAPGA
jgi:hypothetical protein